MSGKSKKVTVVHASHHSNNKAIKKKKRIAGTQHDQRCSDATKINNSEKNVCIRGHKITATQDGDAITLTCACVHTCVFHCTKRLNHYDALVEFSDTHPPIA